jgi:hypothetical protein
MMRPYRSIDLANGPRARAPTFCLFAISISCSLLCAVASTAPCPLAGPTPSEFRPPAITTPSSASPVPPPWALPPPPARAPRFVGLPPAPPLCRKRQASPRLHRPARKSRQIPTFFASRLLAPPSAAAEGPGRRTRRLASSLRLLPRLLPTGANCGSGSPVPPQNRHSPTAHTAHTCQDTAHGRSLTPLTTPPPPAMKVAG